MLDGHSLGGHIGILMRLYEYERNKKMGCGEEWIALLLQNVSDELRVVNILMVWQQKEMSGQRSIYFQNENPHLQIPSKIFALICSICLVMSFNTNFCLDKLILVINVLNYMSSHVYLYSSTIYTALVSWSHLFVCYIFGLNLTMFCGSKECIVRREHLAVETALAPPCFLWNKASTLVRFLPVLCWENKILSFSLAYLPWHNSLMPFSKFWCYAAFRILQNAGEELARE